MKSRHPPGRYRPVLEQLEERMCPSAVLGLPVLLTVTLHSSDLFENGEGENAFVYGSAHGSSPIGVVTAYEEPALISTTALANGETFTASIRWGDGDESVDVSETDAGVVSLNPKKMAANLADFTLKQAVEDQANGFKCLTGGKATGLDCSRDWFRQAASEFANAFENWKEVVDPADPNFKVIARPVTPHVRPLRARHGGLTVHAAQTLTALLENEAQALGVGQAFVTSANRAQGAEEAQATVWVRRQLRAVKKYEHQLARLLLNQVALRRRASRALLADLMFLSGPVTAADVRSVQEQVSGSGLPAELVADLRHLGVDPDTLDAIRRAVIVQDPAAVASLADPPLADPQLLQALRATAAALRE
jgi:hypothetical protein